MSEPALQMHFTRYKAVLDVNAELQIQVRTVLLQKLARYFESGTCSKCNSLTIVDVWYLFDGMGCILKAASLLFYFKYYSQHTLIPA